MLVFSEAFAQNCVMVRLSAEKRPIFPRNPSTFDYYLYIVVSGKRRAILSIILSLSSYHRYEHFFEITYTSMLNV